MQGNSVGSLDILQASLVLIIFFCFFLFVFISPKLKIWGFRHILLPSQNIKTLFLYTFLGYVTLDGGSRNLISISFFCLSSAPFMLLQYNGNFYNHRPADLPIFALAYYGAPESRINGSRHMFMLFP